MLAGEELTVMKFKLVVPFHSELTINMQSIVKRGLKYSFYQTHEKEKSSYHQGFPSRVLLAGQKETAAVGALTACLDSLPSICLYRQTDTLCPISCLHRKNATQKTSLAPVVVLFVL